MSHLVERGEQPMQDHRRLADGGQHEQALAARCRGKDGLRDALGRGKRPDGRLRVARDAAIAVERRGAEPVA